MDHKVSPMTTPVPIRPPTHKSGNAKVFGAVEQTPAEQTLRQMVNPLTLLYRDRGDELAFRGEYYGQWAVYKTQTLLGLFILCEIIFLLSSLLESDPSVGKILLHGVWIVLAVLASVAARCRMGRWWRRRALPTFVSVVCLSASVSHAVVAEDAMSLLVFALYPTLDMLLGSLMWHQQVLYYVSFQMVLTALVVVLPRIDKFPTSSGFDNHLSDDASRVGKLRIAHIWITTIAVLGMSYMIHLMERVSFAKVRAAVAEQDTVTNLMGAVVDPVIQTDEFGSILGSNKAAAQILGCEETELRHLDMDDLLVAKQHREDSGEKTSVRFKSLVSPLRKGEGSSAGGFGVQGQRVAVRHRKGHQIVMSLSIGMTRPASGEPSTYIVCLHDMREYVRQQEALERSNVEAEVLRRSHQTRREFLRYIFHEVRVPFNALTVGIEALINDLSTPPVTRNKENLETLSIMLEQATAMSRILDDVLSMQKIEENQLKLEQQPVSLRRMVFGMVMTFQPACVRNGIELVVKTDDCPSLMVEADLPRLQQVISNLTSNAVKFTKAGGTVTVTAFVVSCKRGMQTLPGQLVDQAAEEAPSHLRADPFGSQRSVKGQGSSLPPINPTRGSMGASKLSEALFGEGEAGPTIDTTSDVGAATADSYHPGDVVTIRVQVRDSGIGISAADKARLFTPYVQIKAGETQKGRGTGLGLSIAKHIVERHGGRIDCDSEPGSGSTFFLEIPFMVAENTAKGPRTPTPNRSRKFMTPVHRSLSARSPGAASKRSDGSVLSRSPVHSHGGSAATIEEAKGDEDDSDVMSVAPTVLLVEDSVANQKITGRALRQMGYGCAIAENGQVCLDMIFPSLDRGEPCPYPLIFMDQEMPIMNGDAATRALRSRGVTVPIIAITGNALKEDRDAFMAAGATEVLTKPVRMTRLRQVLADLFGT